MGEGKKILSFRAIDSFLKRKENNRMMKDRVVGWEEEGRIRNTQQRAVGIADKVTDRLGVCVCVYVCGIHRCERCVSRGRWSTRASRVSAER